MGRAQILGWAVAVLVPPPDATGPKYLLNGASCGNSSCPKFCRGVRRGLIVEFVGIGVSGHFRRNLDMLLLVVGHGAAELIICSGKTTPNDVERCQRNIF